MEKFKSAQIDLPENDDSMYCECDAGTDKYGNECTYCEGLGIVSARHYDDLKSLERDESDL